MSTTEMRFRQAGVADAAAIAQIYVTTRRAAYASFYPFDVLAAMSVQEEASRWRTRLGGEAARALVAVDATNAIAGFTHIRWHDDLGAASSRGEVEFMYIATQHQGIGLGGQLMEQAEAGLATAGFDEALLWVYEDNTKARRFYERRGWHADGGMRASGSAPGLYLLRYGKHLAPESH